MARVLNIILIIFVSTACGGPQGSDLSETTSYEMIAIPEADAKLRSAGLEIDWLGNLVVKGEKYASPVYQAITKVLDITDYSDLRLATSVKRIRKWYWPFDDVQYTLDAHDKKKNKFTIIVDASETEIPIVLDPRAGKTVQGINIEIEKIDVKNSAEIPVVTMRKKAEILGSSETVIGTVNETTHHTVVEHLIRTEDN